MDRFDQRTRELLLSAGWYEGRSIDPLPYLEILKGRQTIAHNAARAFYREFGGLRVDSKAGIHRAILDFSVCGWDEGLSYDNELIEFEKSSGMLCPIGQFSFNASDLLIAPDGKIYAWYDLGGPMFVWLAGRSPEEMIESVCWHPNWPVLMRLEYSQRS